jgi:hypothetical protein
VALVSAGKLKIFQSHFMRPLFQWPRYILPFFVASIIKGFHLMLGGLLNVSCKTAKRVKKKNQMADYSIL